MNPLRLRLLRGALILALATTSFITLAVPADAAITAYERDATTRVNRSRQAARIPTLRIGDGLAWLARQHSCDMARSQNLRHRPSISRGISNWRYLGENVGVSWSLADVHERLMDSHSHRANILSRRYREVGVGVCRDAYGGYWITQIFRG